MRVLVGRPHRNKLVLELLFESCQPRAYLFGRHLRAVVAADDKAVFGLDCFAPDRNRKRAAQAYVGAHDLARVYVHQAEHEEEALLTVDVTVIEVTLPELLGTRDHAVPRDFATSLCPS